MIDLGCFAILYDDQMASVAISCTGRSCRGSFALLLWSHCMTCSGRPFVSLSLLKSHAEVFQIGRSWPCFGIKSHTIHLAQRGIAGVFSIFNALADQMGCNVDVTSLMWSGVCRLDRLGTSRCNLQVCKESHNRHAYARK